MDAFQPQFLSVSKTARALNKLLFERLLRYDSKEPFFGLPLCRHAAKFSFLYAHVKPVLKASLPRG